MSGTSSRFEKSKRSHKVQGARENRAFLSRKPKRSQYAPPFSAFKAFLQAHTRATDVFQQLYNITTFQMYKRLLENPKGWQDLKTCLKILSAMILDERYYGISTQQLRSILKRHPSFPDARKVPSCAIVGYIQQYLPGMEEEKLTRENLVPIYKPMPPVPENERP
jgi:hypothetical protein